MRQTSAQQRVRGAGWHIGTGLLMLFAATSVMAESRPDYRAAAEFGAALQTDFLARHEAALLERIDGKAMRRRVFGPFGNEVAESEDSRRAWTETFLPTLTRELKNTAAGASAFVFCRVMLLDEARQVEGMLVGTDGALYFLRLHLCLSADGHVAIDDFCFAGAELEATRAMRHSMILLGFRSDRPLDDEETQLCLLSEGQGGRFRRVLELMGQRNFDAAYEALAQPVVRIDETKIWRELRNKLAMAGSEAARRDLGRAIEAGAADSFLQYQFWQASGDRVRTLAALEQVLVDYRELPFLRIMKAGLLVELQRPRKALAVANEVIECNPGLVTAYFTAVRAAVAAHELPTALKLLQFWGEIQAPETVVAMIEQEAALADFVKGADYVDWKQRTLLSAAAVKTPAQAAPLSKTAG